MAKTKFTRDELEIVSELPVADGEYAECSLCRVRARTREDLVHCTECMLADRDVVEIEIKGVIDPALVCTKCYGRGRHRHWVAQDESEVRICDRCKGSGKSEVVT